MKALCSGLTFFNFSTVCALLLGIFAGGLNRPIAAIALMLGAAAASFAYFRTIDPEKRVDVLDLAKPEPPRDPAGTTPHRRYASVWIWLFAGCFGIFAVRSFCWLLYLEGNELKIQSPHNLGDLALHITYIRNFASGVRLWPDNPIYAFSRLRYPAGTDLFNALLTLVHVDLIHGLVWTGLLASIAAFYALYRWGGLLTVAGFLFNGGVAGFEFLNSHKFIDYQAEKTIAWKNIALTMFVTQRGLLYAIPAGLLLLWHWRDKFFRNQGTAASKPPSKKNGGLETAAPWITGALPFWVELSLYASMPLFHMHTFLALTIVLVFLFAFGNAQARGQIITLIAGALIPATFFVWLITDHFQAKSVLEWYPGWVLHKKGDNDFYRPFFEFWWVNFGIWIPLVIALVVICAWRAWNRRAEAPSKLPEDLAFLFPAAAIFVLGLLVKMAPWEWDNLKIMIWGYFLVLPYLWTQLIARWPVPIRVPVCIALFGSGFVSLFGGLAAGRPGFGFANRAEVDWTDLAVKKLPVDARFAAFPIYNHSLLLQGRKVVLGYPGHLWTQGFDYSGAYEALGSLMNGSGNWPETARRLGVRYIFWGREEINAYPASTKPWENMLKPIASDPKGTIYDLEQIR